MTELSSAVQQAFISVTLHGDVAILNTKDQTTDRTMKKSITCRAVASGRRLVHSLIAVLAIVAFAGCVSEKCEKQHKEAKQA